MHEHSQGQIGRSAPQTIDSAALAGASIAVALAVFLSPGPFVPMNAAVGMTVLTILLTYELGRERTGPQNFAFGAACGLCALLIVGFVLEFWRGNFDPQYWKVLEATKDSRVGPWSQAFWWLGLTLAFSWVGYKWRVPRRQTNPASK